MSILRTGVAILLSLFLVKGFAGTNPVTSSLSPASGFHSVNSGESTSVVYTLTVNSRFPKSVVIRTNFKKTGGTFTTTDGCNNQSLNPGGSCQVILTFTANDATPSSIQMSYQYDKNVITLPALGATGSGVTPDVVGTITQLPPQFSLSNPEQQPIFKITFTNRGPLSLIGFAGNGAGGEFFVVTPIGIVSVTVVPGQNFCGTSSAPIVLKPGHQCSISGQLTPIAVGKFSITGLFTYNNGANKVTASGIAAVVNGSGSCQLSADATLPFQNPTYQYADNVLKFTFTNPCNSAVSLGNVTYSSTGASSSPIITPSAGSLNGLYDNCSGTTLASKSSCTVLVSVIPQLAGSLNVTAQVMADSLLASAQTSTTVQVPSYSHKVTFVNQCPFPVWYGVSQPTGSTDPTPSPSPAAYLLPAQADGALPATKSITIPGSYSGQFFPRTGCTLQGSSFICATGDCASGANAQCPANNGAVYEPYTRIEETFTSSSQGGYDVSLINGTSIPSELKGLGPFSSQVASPASPYFCTAAGAPIQPPYPQFNPSYPPPPPPLPPLPAPVTPLGNCPWEYNAPSSSPLFNFVTNGTTVTSCGSCSSSSVCGLAFQTTPEAGNIVLACGNLLGYWTINQLCSGNVNYTGANPAMNPTTVFHCNDPITDYSNQSYPGGTTVYDLYACVPQGATLQSCYNLSSGISTCCGAQNWNAVTPYVTWQTQQSYTTNPDWVNGSTGGLPALSPTPLESIQWLKNACPTAYAYPFDDHAGTFSCNTSDAGQQNPVLMDFEIVFCPGGIVGDLSLSP